MYEYVLRLVRRGRESRPEALHELAEANFLASHDLCSPGVRWRGRFCVLKGCKMSGKRSQSNGKRRGSLMSGRLLRTSSLSALALLALPSIAQAQDAIRNWDPNGTAAGTGGAGTLSLIHI